MLFIWLPGERNPGPDGSVSTSGCVFSVSIFNVIVLLGAVSYWRDRIGSSRYLKGISKKEQLAWFCTKKLWVVQ